MHRAQRSRDGRVPHSSENSRLQKVLADTGPAQALHQHDFKKPLQNHVPPGPVGGALFYNKIDDAGEASGVTFSRTHMDHPGQ